FESRLSQTLTCTSWPFQMYGNITKKIAPTTKSKSLPLSLTADFINVKLNSFHKSPSFRRQHSHYRPWTIDHQLEWLFPVLFNNFASPKYKPTWTMAYWLCTNRYARHLPYP